MTFVRAVGLTNRGAFRVSNEDCIAIDRWVEQRDMTTPLLLEAELDGPFLCAVADGMGGHASGEIASALALRELIKEARQIDDTNRLDVVLREINRIIFMAMADDRAYTGMGTTLAGLILRKDEAFVFNVGDSRIYGGDKTGVELLSSDDTMAAVQSVSPRERTGRHGHQLLQCFGGSAEFVKIEPHVSVLSLEELPLRFILCSDGLTDMLDQDEIEECIRNAGEHLERIAKDLFDAAMKKGGKDNFSVIVADVTSTRVEPDTGVSETLPPRANETPYGFPYGVSFIILMTLLVMIAPIARNYLRQTLAVNDYPRLLFFFLAAGLLIQITSSIAFRIQLNAQKYQRLFSAGTNVILYAMIGTALATLLIIASRAIHFAGGLNFADAGHYGAFLLGVVSAVTGLWPPRWLFAPLRARFTPLKRLTFVAFATLAFCVAFNLFAPL